MNDLLTPTMEKALNLAKAHGGKLYRHPGGFWAGPEFQSYQGGMGSSECYGTPTVNGLVVRGAAEYSDYKEGRGGDFPVEITLISDE